VQLLASQSVVQALRDFRSEIDASNVNKSRGAHNALLSRLIGEIRGDINLPGKRVPPTLRLASGVQELQATFLKGILSGIAHREGPEPALGTAHKNGAGIRVIALIPDMLSCR
jgi:hypothetical protein